MDGSKVKNIGVFTSGGDSPGMNAAIRAVVRSAIHYGCRAFGIYRGYEGMIDNEIREMDSSSVSNIIQRGGTILKSARSQRFLTPEGRSLAAANLKKNGIDALVAIGGDGTFRGAHALYEEHGIACIGIPGTIDNDLYGTDFTLGYDTAINTVTEAIDKIRDTADSHERLFFVEVMGRDAGFIALRSGIACGAEAILIPETETRIEELAAILDHGKKRKKSSSIVIVAEGDDAGGAFDVAKKVKEKIDYFDTRVVVLGHLQRGGSPSCMDRVLGSKLGLAAVEGLLDGKKNVMAGQLHREVVYTPFEKATKHHQTINPALLRLAEILAS